MPGTYQFLLTALDGALLGGAQPDAFRIKIWNESGLVYDNAPGSDAMSQLR
jgi:hypothetical protein